MAGRTGKGVVSETTGKLLIGQSFPKPQKLYYKRTHFPVGTTHCSESIISCTSVRRVCFATLPFPARSRRISSVAGSSREPAFAGQPGRETRRTAIPPATSMPWYQKRHWCLATSAVCLAKFRRADNRLAHRGSHSFYLAFITKKHPGCEEGIALISEWTKPRKP